MNNLRQSNIELLRIVAILFVICHHIIVHGLKIYDMPIEAYPWLYSFVNCICYVGVNVFILISGYFSIKFSWKKLLYLYLMCVLVAAICYIGHCLDAGTSVGRTLIYHNSIFAFSHHSLWYVLPYICLYLLSPFINKLLSVLSRKEFRMLIIVLLIISWYFGWFWQNAVNSNGYCLMQFIMVYIIGRYIRLYNVAKEARMPAWGGVNLVFAALQCLLVFIILKRTGQQNFPPLPSIHAYNSPFLMASSLGIFCLFVNLNIQSKIINWIAKSTFGVLLIHCNPYVWGEFWISHLQPLYTHGIEGVLMATLLLYVGCFVFDVLIRYGIVLPLYNAILSLFNK